MIRIFKSGRHALRTPLSYPALQECLDPGLVLVPEAAEADLWLFAHVMDIEALPSEMIGLWRRRRCPIVLLSEEPFWDTIWGRRPLDRHIAVETDWGALPVIQINHTTSTLYRFDRVPYYLLTNPRFERTYIERFARNAGLSAADWQADFARRAQTLTVMFERRPEPYHDISWPGAGLYGLCAWRTRLAEALSPGQCERLGASWQGGPTRFELADWYGDKMRRLDRHARMLGAFENTHHPDYITEKFFDAMACGSVPLYAAAPDHRIHDLGLPAGAWINLWGLEAAEAADRLRSPAFGAGFWEDFRAAQGLLHAFFATPDLFRDERSRLRDALMTELAMALDSPIR